MLALLSLSTDRNDWFPYPSMLREARKRFFYRAKPPRKGHCMKYPREYHLRLMFRVNVNIQHEDFCSRYHHRVFAFYPTKNKFCVHKEYRQLCSFVSVCFADRWPSWSQKKCRYTSTRGMSLAFSLYWMYDGGEEKKITWLLWSCSHLLRTRLYIETKTWWACNIEKSKSNTFFNTNTSSCLYQCYCLSSHFTIHYYFIFPQKCKSVLYFLQLLG